MRRFVFMVSLMACMSVTAVYSQNAKEYKKGVPFNGLIRDQMGQPMKGVYVGVLGKSGFTVSDKKGRFGLLDVLDTDTLYLMVRKTHYNVPVEGRKSMSLRLIDQESFIVSEDQRLVDEGYGYVTRRNHTGVSSGISGDDLMREGHSDLLTALQGKVPGLNITRNGTDEMDVSMRGRNSVHMPQTPLYIVDGVEVSSLSEISLSDVDYVEVVKDASIYGSRGANGAILVRTKH